MAEVRFPSRLRQEWPKQSSLHCAGHRRWVRRHSCCVQGCNRLPIECAHVRSGAGAGLGLKPSDSRCISLCWLHHREQHDIGERAFEWKYDLDLCALAVEFARKSPFRNSLV
jgi:hypothetical protein